MLSPGSVCQFGWLDGTPEGRTFNHWATHPMKQLHKRSVFIEMTKFDDFTRHLGRSPLLEWTSFPQDMVSATGVFLLWSSMCQGSSVEDGATRSVGNKMTGDLRQFFITGYTCPKVPYVLYAPMRYWNNIIPLSVLLKNILQIIRKI